MVDEKGYDVKLVDGFPDKYRCHFCHLVFRDPVQTFRGERACKSCYFAFKSLNPAVCPIDKEPIDDDEIFQDKHLMREIGQLKCYCNNNDLGCSWKGDLLELQKHLDSCGFNYISCDMCSTLVLKISLMTHQNEECLFRLTSCSDCDLNLKAIELEKHALFCPKRPVECPYNCKKEAPFSELFKHFQVCPQLKENFTCPYKLIGCLHQANNFSALESHLRSSDHFMMTVTMVKKLQESNENLKSELLKQKEFSEQQSLKYQNMRKEIETIKIDLKSCEDKVNHLSLAQEPVTEDQFTKFEKQLNECKKKIDELLPKKTNTNVNDFRSLEPKIANISTIADKIEVTNAILGESMSDIDLKLQILENTRYDGRHLWRINNFRFRLRQAEEGKCPAIHSAPSFTGRGGYKFCSRLYLNGDGSGAKTHISLYFVIMRSEYDQLLEWPFKKRVTFRLINVINQKESHEESFKPDINSSSFQRPVKDMNIAAGCPLFFPKEFLFSPKYLVDDSIFLEIIVNE